MGWGMGSGGWGVNTETGGLVHIHAYSHFAMLMLWTSTRCGSISCDPMQPMFASAQPKAHTHKQETERARTEWKLARKLLEQAMHQKQQSGRHPEGGYMIDDWDESLAGRAPSPVVLLRVIFLRWQDHKTAPTSLWATFHKHTIQFVFCNRASRETLTSMSVIHLKIENNEITTVNETSRCRIRTCTSDSILQIKVKL